MGLDEDISKITFLDVSKFWNKIWVGNFFYLFAFRSIEDLRLYFSKIKKTKKLFNTSEQCIEEKQNQQSNKILFLTSDNTCCLKIYVKIPNRFSAEMYIKATFFECLFQELMLKKFGLKIEYKDKYYSTCEKCLEVLIENVYREDIASILEKVWSISLYDFLTTDLREKYSQFIDGVTASMYQENSSDLHAISKELGISKNTAKKFMQQPAQVHGLKGSHKGSKLDPYKPKLQEWMSQGIFNCEVVMERLQALGYDGGKCIFKEYVHPYRPAGSAPAVLAIDEIGYSQLNRQEAELFFCLISERYEHGSVILTSNKYFSAWGELRSDTVLATELLDRLLHHAHVINIRGETYRLRDRLKAGIQTAPPAEIPSEL